MKKGEGRFRTLTENATDMVFYRMSIPDGRYEYVSPASSILFGYSNKINAEIGQEIGINTFTYKPFSKADLACTVREVLEKA